MTERDWIFLLIGINLGLAVLIYISIAAFVQGFYKGYMQSKQPNSKKDKS